MERGSESGHTEHKRGDTNTRKREWDRTTRESGKGGTRGSGHTARAAAEWALAKESEWRRETGLSAKDRAGIFSGANTKSQQTSSCHKGGGRADETAGARRRAGCEAYI